VANSQRSELQKNTQHKARKWTQSTRREKNEDQFNLSSCLLCFQGGFMFEDSFKKKVFTQYLMAI